MGRKLGVALALVALAAAGCGKDKTAEYVHALNQAQEDFGSKVVTDSSGIGASSSEADLKPVLAKQAGDVSALATRVAALKPPKGVEAAQAQLVAALRGYASTLREDDPALVARDTRLAQDKVHAAVSTINGMLP